MVDFVCLFISVSHYQLFFMPFIYDPKANFKIRRNRLPTLQVSHPGPHLPLTAPLGTLEFRCYSAQSECVTETNHQAMEACKSPSWYSSLFRYSFDPTA